MSSGFIVFALVCSQAFLPIDRAADQDGAFTMPRLVPNPADARYELDKALEIGDGLKVAVTCPDAKAAGWIADHAKAWWKASVRVSAADGPMPAQEEGYELRTGADGVTIAAPALCGVRYAMYTLRQMTEPKRGTPTLAGWECPYAAIRDAPKMGFRGIHFVCGRETPLEFLEHGIRQAAYYKMNHVVLENWGEFRSKRHPWYGWSDGKLTYGEIRRLRDIADDVGVVLIPAINVFGHAALASERNGKHAAIDLAPEYQPLFEPEGGWNWCLSNPTARQTVADIVLELHDAFGRPPYFHIGCDEARKATCRRCASHEGGYDRLVVEHIASLAVLLRERGATTMMWHDKLVAEGDPRWKGFVANGSADADALLRSLPRDILICDWYYGKTFEWGGESNPGSYPTLEYFRSLGFRTLTCPWEDDVGARAQIKWSIAHGVFGALATTWNRCAALFLYREFQAADAMWGSPHPQGRFTFMQYWRQTGWDMPTKTYRACGFCSDPRHFEY